MQYYYISNYYLCKVAILYWKKHCRSEFITKLLPQTAAGLTNNPTTKYAMARKRFDATTNMLPSLEKDARKLFNCSA